LTRTIAPHFSEARTCSTSVHLSFSARRA